MRGLVSLTGQLASVDDDLTGRENLILLGRLLGYSTKQARVPRRRAARRVRPRGGGGTAREELLGRHAPPARHRGEHRRHARADVPRRADDRPGPALAQPGVGHHPRARRPGHDRAAVHAVPRRGRPARRPHRRHRPRQGHRRGHAGAAEGVGRRRRAARAPARPRAARRGGAAARPARSTPSRISRPTRRAVGAASTTPSGPPRRSPSCRPRRPRARQLLARPAEPRRGLPGADRPPRRGRRHRRRRRHEHRHPDDPPAARPPTRRCTRALSSQRAPAAPQRARRPR